MTIALGRTSPAPSPYDDVPPTPGTIVAPPLDQSVATDLKAATEFLYTGADPIQTGVDPGTIEQTARRRPSRPGPHQRRGAASWRDRRRTGSSGVRPDVEPGRRDVRPGRQRRRAVDARTTREAGCLPAQRTVQVPWRDYVVVPDVVLMALDPASRRRPRRGDRGPGRAGKHRSPTPTARDRRRCCSRQGPTPRW